MTSNKKCFYIFILITLTNCKFNSNIDKKKFSINSISIEKNVYTKNKKIDNNTDQYFESEQLFFFVKMHIKNETADTLYVITNKNYNIFFCKNRHIYVGYDSVFVLLKRCRDMFSIRIDTIKPYQNTIYFAEYVNYPEINVGRYFYSEIDLKTFNYYENNSQFDESDNLIDSVYSNIEENRSNKFLIYFDILTDTAHLVDSTFEEVLESYKRRGYIEQ